MATTTSANRLGAWLGQAYDILGDVKSIISDTATAPAPSGSDAAITASETEANPTSAAQSVTSPNAAASSRSSGQTAVETAASASNGQPTSGAAATTAAASISAVPSTLNQARPTATSGVPSSSHQHDTDILPIILGAVLGGVGLILLGLLIWIWLRRRRSKKIRRIDTPEDDDTHSWPGTDRASEPMMTSVTSISGPSGPVSNSHHPPLLAHHPAYRGRVTGSTNPFVPPIPAPRRSSGSSALDASPKETMTSPNLQSPTGINTSVAQPTVVPITTSPVQTHHNPFSSPIAGLAAGVAAHKIRRKPVNSLSSDLSSPTDGSYSGLGWGAESNDHPGGGHSRTHSDQPLIAKDEQGPDPGQGQDQHQTTYTDDRPPTPFGLMTFGKIKLESSASSNTSPNLSDGAARSTPPSEPDRQSFESFTLRPTPAANPRRVSFPDPPVAPISPGSYSHRYNSPLPNSNNPYSNPYTNPNPNPQNNSNAIGYTSYAYPLPVSTNPFSSTPNSPHTNGNSYENSYGNGHGNGYANGNANGNRKQNRISEIRARRNPELMGLYDHPEEEHGEDGNQESPYAYHGGGGGGYRDEHVRNGNGNGNGNGRGNRRGVGMAL